VEKTGLVHRAYGLVVIPNPGSVKLHEKLGFRETGVLHEAGYKLGKYHDVKIYERRFE
jgi:phosphinothricin acetyltransferase